MKNQTANDPQKSTFKWKHPNKMQQSENFLSSTSNEPFRFDLFQMFNAVPLPCDGKTKWLFVTNTKNEQKHSHVYCLLINNVMNDEYKFGMQYMQMRNILDWSADIKHQL